MEISGDIPGGNALASPQSHGQMGEVLADTQTSLHTSSVEVSHGGRLRRSTAGWGFFGLGLATIQVPSLSP